MRTLRHAQKQSESTAEEQSANELVRRIRKLRWMGMEAEAKQVQLELAQVRSEASDSVLAVPTETD